MCLPLSRVTVVSDRATETLLRQDAPSCPRSSFFTVTLKKGSGPAEEGSGENARGLAHSRNISERQWGRGAPTRLCWGKARGEAGPQREWGRPPEQPGTTCPGETGPPRPAGVSAARRTLSPSRPRKQLAPRGVLTCLRPVVWSCMLVGISPPTLQSVCSHLALPLALALPRWPSSPDLGLLAQAVGTGRGGTSRVLPVELPQGWAKT